MNITVIKIITVLAFLIAQSIVAFKAVALALSVQGEVAGLWCEWYMGYVCLPLAILSAFAGFRLIKLLGREWGIK